MHKLHSMFEKLEECASSYLNKGMDQVDTQEMGMVTDMLKDLTEAMYYYSVYEAMKNYGEDYRPEQYDRYGYNRYRYSNGRYAPKGRGRRYYEDEMPYDRMWEDREWSDDESYTSYDPNYYRMGYSGNTNGNGGNSGRSQNMSQNRSDSNNSRYGQSYDRYNSSRRHYHDTNDMESKQKMQESISEVFDDMEMMVQDLAKEMSPEDKNKYRQKLNQMMQKIQ